MPINRKSIQAAPSHGLEGELLQPAGRRSRAKLAVPRIRLDTPKDIRRELGRLYRETRAGRVPTQDATRMAYILDCLRKALETDVLEARIAALESDAAPAAITAPSRPDDDDHEPAPTPGPA